MLNDMRRLPPPLTDEIAALIAPRSRQYYGDRIASIAGRLRVKAAGLAEHAEAYRHRLHELAIETKALSWDEAFDNTEAAAREGLRDQLLAYVAELEAELADVRATLAELAD